MMRYLLILPIVLMMSTGCGRKGDLYLPENAAQYNPSQLSAAPHAAEHRQNQQR